MIENINFKEKAGDLKKAFWGKRNGLRILEISGENQRESRVENYVSKKSNVDQKENGQYRRIGKKSRINRPLVFIEEEPSSQP